MIHRATQIAGSRSIAKICHARTMSTAASLFKGVQLVNAKGEEKDGDECLRGKVLALYFAVSHILLLCWWRLVRPLTTLSRFSSAFQTGRLVPRLP
jgi:hypothetical protein